jgi:hypothetical protein
MLHGALNAHRTYGTTYVSCKGSESEGSHRAGLVKVVSCFGDPGQERGQSVFYFNGETNSANYILFQSIDGAHFG